MEFRDVYGVTRLSQKTYLVVVKENSSVGEMLGHRVYEVKSMALVEIG